MKHEKNKLSPYGLIDENGNEITGTAKELLHKLIDYMTDEQAQQYLESTYQMCAQQDGARQQ